MPLGKDMELLCLVLNDGDGSKALKIARENDVKGGTVFYAEGTVRKGLMRFLGLDSIRREVVLLVGPKNMIDKAFQALAFRMNLDKPHNGIGFTVPLSRVLGIYLAPEEIKTKDRKDAKQVSQAIFTIVDRGQSEEVMEAAQEAGAQGGTVMHARGTGVNQTKLVFNMEIEPEKDIVLIVAEDESVDKIVQAISKRLDIEKPNRGVLFTMELSETRGIG